MMLPVRLLPEARVEFDDATDWYEKQRAGLGTIVVARVRDVLRRVGADPHRYAAVYLDVRKAIVPKFPYVILYPGGAGRGPGRLGISHLERPFNLEIQGLTHGCSGPGHGSRETGICRVRPIARRSLALPTESRRCPMP